MELVGHPAMTSDARLLQEGEATSVRLVAQSTYLLVAGPTAVVDAEELDDDAARWLDAGAPPPPDGAVVVVRGAGASSVAASGERVPLGADGRGERSIPGDALGAGAEIAIDTADAGIVATRLPDATPEAWLEIDGARRPLPLRPLGLRIDLVGLRLSIAWCAAAPIEGSPGDARVLLHAGAAASDEAPRSTRPPPAPRRVPVVVRAAGASSIPAARPDAARHDWDVDSTVSIDGAPPASLPLPFEVASSGRSTTPEGAARRSGAPSSGNEPARPPAEAPRPARLAPAVADRGDERRSIGQILAARGGGPPTDGATDARSGEPPRGASPRADPSRAGRARMGEHAEATAAAPRPGTGRATPPLMLLHVEPGTSARLRRSPRWRSALQAPSRAAERAAVEAGDDPAIARDARDAVAALRGVGATGLAALPSELARALDDGLLVAPVVVVEGELELPLDDVEVLRATVEAVTPLRGMDRRVAEALDRVSPFVEASWLDPSVADAERGHLRGVVAALGRGQTAEAIEAHVARKLRRERKHVVRTWRGAPWIVAALADATTGPSGGGARATVFLPRGAVEVLPVARRFRARLLVVVEPAIEPDLADAPALFALAVARDVSGPGGGAS